MWIHNLKAHATGSELMERWNETNKRLAWNLDRKFVWSQGLWRGSYFNLSTLFKLKLRKCLVNDNPWDSFNALPDINNPIVCLCSCFKHSSEFLEHLTSSYKTYHGIICAFPFSRHANSPNPVQHDYNFAGRFHHVFYYSIFSHRHRILWFSFKIGEEMLSKFFLIARSTIFNLPFVVQIDFFQLHFHSHIWWVFKLFLAQEKKD